MLTKEFNNIFFRKYAHKRAVSLLCIFTIFLSIFFMHSDTVLATSMPYATAQVNSSDGVNVRKSATTKSDIVFGLDNNACIHINKVVFASKTKTSATSKWYYITAEGKSGYLRSDLVDNIKYDTVSAKTTASLNYRVGAGTSMKKIGTLKKGKKITVSLAAKAKGSDSKWYRIKVGSKSYYSLAKYIKITERKSGSSSKCDVAEALLKKSTNGKKVRVVYTFTTANCKKRFSVKGSSESKGGKVPQGMAYDGSNYYILFAMDNTRQCIAKYTKDGKRKKLIEIPDNLGHLNGMTWDDINKVLLITKGNQYKIYTYCPSTGEFGTASTKPRSNSGVAFDSKSNLLYFTSKGTGKTKGYVNCYQADGKYTYESCINRCTRSGTYYVQDCAAYNGFIFHCISTGTKTGNQNYIDVYRASDSSYLGTIQFEMGEVESAIVRNGYLEILCNTPGVPDYIWKTNLKVTDLE